MANTPLAIADGQLPNAKGTLYTCPAATIVVVQTLSVVNTDASDRTVNFYVNRSGTSRRIWDKDKSVPVGEARYYDQGLVVLEAGDLLEGDASVLNVVDYVVSGFKQT